MKIYEEVNALAVEYVSKREQFANISRKQDEMAWNRLWTLKTQLKQYALTRKEKNATTPKQPPDAVKKDASSDASGSQTKKGSKGKKGNKSAPQGKSSLTVKSGDTKASSANTAEESRAKTHTLSWSLAFKNVCECKEDWVAGKTFETPVITVEPK